MPDWPSGISLILSFCTFMVVIKLLESSHSPNSIKKTRFRKVQWFWFIISYYWRDYEPGTRPSGFVLGSFDENISFYWRFLIGDSFSWYLVSFQNCSCFLTHDFHLRRRSNTLLYPYIHIPVCIFILYYTKSYINYLYLHVSLYIWVCIF